MSSLRPRQTAARRAHVVALLTPALRAALLRGPRPFLSCGYVQAGMLHWDEDYAISDRVLFERIEAILNIARLLPLLPEPAAPLAARAPSSPTAPEPITDYDRSSEAIVPDPTA